jgi:hypothetical protein
MNPLTQSKKRTILPVLIAVTLACFGLSPAARAVDPPPDGGYPSESTAEGENALHNCTVCSNETAIGFQALFSVTTGQGNTAIGTNVLPVNTTGSYNTADGFLALFNNTTGNNNTAVGSEALEQNRTGIDNTATGANALVNLFSGSSNIALGANAGMNLTTGDNNIDIGSQGVAADNGTIRIGTAGTQTATFIAGIRDTPLANGGALAVGITADGQLGVRASSVRFKEEINPMNKASEAIFSLQPVTFHYKKDPAALPQFGLVAEEVAKVDPNLVVLDAKGKPLTVRYEEVNAMLLNEFLKEHRIVQEQKATIAELKHNFAEQQKQLKRLLRGY